MPSSAELIMPLYPIDVDGTPALLHRDQTPTDDEISRFTDMVRSVRRKAAEQDRLTCPDCSQGKHAACVGEAFDFQRDEVTPCQCRRCGGRS